jgi:hypothetical protein
MPTLTRWFVKTSLVYLVAAFLLGLALVAMPGLQARALGVALRAVYFHLLVVGWVAQLIFGVAFWMFPRHGAERPRGRAALGFASYALLNLGLVLRTVAEPLWAVRPESAWAWLLGASAVAQWLAALGFVANTWPRVREAAR